MNPVQKLIKSAEFRKQARAFARWYGLERKAVLELGRIAAGWLEHYSRTRNAVRLAEALSKVTDVKVTGRSIMNYRDIYELDCSWRRSQGAGRAKSRNRFKIRNVGAGHLRVVAAAKLPRCRKHDLLDEAERKRLRVKQTVARARRYEIQYNRARRTPRLRGGDPRVMLGDAIDVIKKLEFGSIHHLFADWQWENTGIWRESERTSPVHRQADPVAHVCRLLSTALPYMHKNGILWIFSKTTAFPGGEIGLPHVIQKTAHRLGFQYCSEYIHQHAIAGYRSKNTFLAVKHTPIFPFVRQDFDFTPVTFAPSVGAPLASPNHISQRCAGEERHPYQKPVALFEELIAMGSPRGLVYDAFAGSGAAGVAAVNSYCPYPGAERQRYYVAMANRAIAAALSKQKAATKSA